MSKSPSSTSPGSPGLKLPAWSWIGALVLALSLQWWSAGRQMERVNAMSALPTWSVDAPSVDESTATGWTNEQRHLVIAGSHGPSYGWIREAQIAAEQGTLRLRHIDYDSAPDGREIRRSMPYRAWLITVGWGRSALTGEPLGLAIERGALVADPLLWSLLLIAGTWFCQRHWGSASAVVFALGGATLFPLAAGFSVGAPDPHSLAWVLAAGALLPLLAGPNRINCVVAGICGGLGFWNDAVSQQTLLLAITVGGLVTAFSPGRVVQPACWRTWGISGAATTLLAGVIEFGPGHWGWALHTVHPMHALAWWGAAEVVRAVSLWRAKAKPAQLSNTTLVTGAVGLVVLLAWPVAAWWQDATFVLAPDFHANQMANHFRASGGRAPLVAGLGLVLLVAITVVAWRENRQNGDAKLTVLPLATGLPLVILTFIQPRWWNLLDVVVLAALAAACVGSRLSVARLIPCAAVFLFSGVHSFPGAARLKSGEVNMTAEEARAIVARDYAYWINQRRGESPVVLFSTPSFAERAAFYGGFRSIASADGDNADGLNTSVRIASADTEQEIQILLESREITHLALPQWDPMTEQLVRWGYGTPTTEPLPRSAFVAALLHWDLPAWIHPMDYVVSVESQYHGLNLTSFAVGEPQSPAVALARLANFFVHRNQFTEAQAVREVLKDYPRDPLALIAMANIDVAVRDAARLNETLTTLVPMLSRRSARNLPADFRVTLATVFTRVNRPELARTEIQKSFEQLTLETLRSWSPGSVIDLLSNSRALNEPWPTAHLREAALELIPPRVRSQFQVLGSSAPD